MEEQLIELLKRLEEAAPWVWAIYLKQQYVVVAMDFTWLTVLVLLACGFYKAGFWMDARRQSLDKYNEARMAWGFGEAISFIFLAIAVIVIPFLLTDGIARAVNPEYYAIKGLLSLIVPN